MHTEESHKNMSEAQKGHKVSDTTRAKIGKVHKGRVISEETRIKISETKKGKKLSLESIEKREATRKANREADPTYGKSSKPSPNRGSATHNSLRNWQREKTWRDKLQPRAKLLY